MQEVGFNLLDALRTESLALQWVPADMVRELIDQVEESPLPEGSYPSIAVMIQNGEMTMRIGSFARQVPIQAGSVWSVSHLAALYAGIWHLIEGASESDRLMFHEVVAMHAQQLADMPVTAEHMTDEEHARFHVGHSVDHEHPHSSEGPATPQSDGRPGMYL